MTKTLHDVKVIPPGNYTIKSTGKKLQELFEGEKRVNVKLDDDEKGSIVIKNPLHVKINFDRDLNRFASFNGFLVNCDLLDKN